MPYSEQDREVLKAALTKRVGGAKALEYLDKIQRGQELTYLEKRQIAESRPERPLTVQEANTITDSLGVQLPTNEPRAE